VGKQRTWPIKVILRKGSALFVLEPWLVRA
jgi:hypothetical protein